MSRTSSACRPTVVNARGRPELAGDPAAQSRRCRRRAWATVTPGRIRPMTRRNRFPRGPLLEVVPERLPDLETIGHARIRRQQQPERPRHDADDRRRLVVDEDLPSDDRRIAAEAALEQLPAEQDRRRGARRAVLGAERASERALGAEDLEEVGRSRTPSGAAPDRRRPDSATVPVAQMAPNSAQVVLPSRRFRRSGPESGPRGYPIAV